MAMVFKLNQEGGNVSPHITVDLMMQVPHVPSVIVVHHRSGLIKTFPSPGKDSIPHLRVAAAPGSAHIQTLIKQSHLIKDAPPEGHVGTGPNLPGWGSTRP